MSHRFSPRPNRADQIAWREWGAEAFAEAGADGRPVLLSVSAVWCHWCHVMDETTYSDPTVMELIREHLVPIRVDADQRPDVDHRYNMGGWPTTAFLDADGELLTGATYLPPAEMAATIRQVVSYLQRARPAQPAPPAVPRPKRSPDRRHIDQLYEEIAGAYDRRHGGFGHAPKFPLTDVLAFLLDLAGLGGHVEARPMVLESVTRMVEDGLYDPVEGGFFRYSTTQDWSQPHYEKMLDDQAAMLEVLLGLGDDVPKTVREATAGTADYMVRVLYDGSCLGGSQDADQAYYAGDLTARRQGTPPLVDRTVYAGWVARATRALVAAGVILDRPQWAEAGETAFRTMLARCLGAGILRHTDQPGALSNLSADVAQVGLTALFLGAVTPGSDLGTVGDECADLLLRSLSADGFPELPEFGLGRLRHLEYPLAVNAWAGQLMAWLDDIRPDPTLAGAWQAALKAAASAAAGQSLLAAAYGRMLVIDQVRPCVVSLPKDLPRDGLAAVLSALPPGAVLRADAMAPGVVVCRGQQCSRPLQDAAHIQRQLRAEVPTAQAARAEDAQALAVDMGRIPTGADLLAFFQEWASRHQVETAWVSAIGALTKCQIAFFDQRQRRYQPLSFDEPLEILSLTGNLSLADGQPFAHLHLVAGRADGTTIGGHVLTGCEVYTGEYRISVQHGPPLTRSWDEKLGLRLWPPQAGTDR